LIQILEAKVLKKSILFLSFLSAVLVGSIFISCTNRSGKTESAETENHGSESVVNIVKKIDMGKWNYNADDDVYWQVGIVYVAKPVDTKYETLGLFVPGKYFDATRNEDGTYSVTVNVGGSVNGYTSESAPYVMPVNTPGYSAFRPADGYSRQVKEYTDAGFHVVESSHDQMLPDDKIHEIFSGHTVGIAGQSGVGKSTLCHRLTGMDQIEVGSISERLKRGKHTTRHVELFPFEGGFLIDTPGFSSLDVDRIGLEEEDLAGGYPELLRIAGKCRFQDCRHTGELGCAIGECGISDGRLARYREFLDIILVNSKKYGKKKEGQ